MSENINDGALDPLTIRDEVLAGRMLKQNVKKDSQAVYALKDFFQASAYDALDVLLKVDAGDTKTVEKCQNIVAMYEAMCAAMNYVIEQGEVSSGELSNEQVDELREILGEDFNLYMGDETSEDE